MNCTTVIRTVLTSCYNSTFLLAILLGLLDMTLLSFSPISAEGSKRSTTTISMLAASSPQHFGNPHDAHSPDRRHTSLALTLEQHTTIDKQLSVRIPKYSARIPAHHHARSMQTSHSIFCKSKNVTDSINKMRKRIDCIPRDIIVDLVGPNNATWFFDCVQIVPRAVMVKRCGGICSGFKSCVASQQKSVQFLVRVVDQEARKFYCHHIDLLEDVSCACGCEQINTECSSPKQAFDSNMCQCTCSNKEEIKSCTSKRNHKWNHKTCSCGCKNEKVCTTGAIWMADKCRCVKS